jgi:hypothetical protein
MMFESDGTQVAVVKADNTVHFQKISIGQDLGQRIEVISGLSPQDQVVINPGEKLTEGLTVQMTAGSGSNAASNQPAVAQADFAAPESRTGGGAAK